MSAGQIPAWYLKYAASSGECVILKLSLPGFRRSMTYSLPVSVMNCCLTIVSPL
jgi:hypothetical protein